MIQRQQQLQHSVLLAERHVTKHYLKQAFIGRNHFLPQAWPLLVSQKHAMVILMSVCAVQMLSAGANLALYSYNPSLKMCALGPSYL